MQGRPSLNPTNLGNLSNIFERRILEMSVRSRLTILSVTTRSTKVTRIAISRLVVEVVFFRSAAVSSPRRMAAAARSRVAGTTWPHTQSRTPATSASTSASERSIRRFVITEKAPTRSLVYIVSYSRLYDFCISNPISH